MKRFLKKTLNFTFLENDASLKKNEMNYLIVIIKITFARIAKKFLKKDI